MERRLRDSQFGFMPGRGVADAIFAVRQRMEMYISRKGVR